MQKDFENSRSQPWFLSFHTSRLVEKTAFLASKIFSTFTFDNGRPGKNLIEPALQ
jgi:hypothetical protein